MLIPKVDEAKVIFPFVLAMAHVFPRLKPSENNLETLIYYIQNKLPVSKRLLSELSQKFTKSHMEHIRNEMGPIYSNLFSLQLRQDYSEYATALYRKNG